MLASFYPSLHNFPKRPGGRDPHSARPSAFRRSPPARRRPRSPTTPRRSPGRACCRRDAAHDRQVPETGGRAPLWGRFRSLRRASPLSGLSRRRSASAHQRGRSSPASRFGAVTTAAVLICTRCDRISFAQRGSESLCQRRLRRTILKTPLPSSNEASLPPSGVSLLGFGN